MKKYTLLLLIVTLFFQSSYAAKMSAKKAYLYGKMYTQFIAPQAIRNLHSLLGAIFEQKDFSDKKMTPREEQIQWAANDLMCQCAKPTKENYQACRAFIKGLKRKQLSKRIIKEFNLSVYDVEKQLKSTHKMANQLEKKLNKFTNPDDFSL